MNATDSRYQNHNPDQTWQKILDLDELQEGRVTTVTVGHRSLAVTKHEGRYGCLDNACPHQGGPLGEGSIEDGWLRCPWHGYDYSPHDGKPPEGFSDAPECFTVETRDDGVYALLPNDEMHQRSVADLVVDTLVEWGLTHVFGMVGHSNLGVADAIRRAEQEGKLTFIGIRHEGAASFAASAYGKFTGRPAACFAIAGPGSTNLLTGLYDAKEDAAPVIALSGQVPSAVKGRGAFQDTDLEAAFSSVAGFSETVNAGSNHAELASLAMKNAIVKRSVSHLIFPDDVQTKPVPADAKPGIPAGRVATLETPPPEAALGVAIDMMRAAKRPMIVVGAGCRGHMASIIDLATALGAPVATTFKAKGLIADSHPLGCGVLGRSGTPVASWMMNESDLLVVFGASFANHTGIASYKPIIQVDADPMALGRFHPVQLPLLGHVAATATSMSKKLEGHTAVQLQGDVETRWKIWREEKAKRELDDAASGIGSAAVMACLTRNIAADAAIAVDVGNNTYSFGRYFEASGAQDLVMSGYLGSIGFSLPAAMGAWAAFGDSRQIVSVSGDGGFGQYAMELTTAVKYQMNLTHFLLNNSELGKISKEQSAAHFEVFQTGLHNPNFAEFANLCGAKGIRVTDPSELDAAAREALDHPGAALVEIVTNASLV